ncbi:hypothetical protein NQ314_002321 [Rhamnusium bicolor]|uniref:Uncharacterized protein n=1 Tax=Rhamnusium bicolor TaxID=1586634 RepID=A0AAV8ZT94_9CUCU|nr:hypothetical protein NQ314_002321 [Rhamnusium bicolor]
MQQINMPRRCNDQASDQEPPKKKSSSAISNSIELKQGEILTDISGKKWRLGKPVGIGGIWRNISGLRRSFERS